MIEQAAAIIGVTTSDFFVSKAYEAAKAVIRDHETWVLTRTQSKEFVVNVLNPAEPNEALKAAVALYRSRSKA